MNSMILFLLVACITLTLWRGTDGAKKIMKPANGLYKGKKVLGIIVDSKKGKCAKCKKNGCCNAKQTRKCGGKPSGCDACKKIEEGFQELNAKLKKIVGEVEKKNMDTSATKTKAEAPPSPVTTKAPPGLVTTEAPHIDVTTYYSIPTSMKVE